MDEYISVLLPRAEDYMKSMRADHVEHYANKSDIWSDAQGDRAAARWLSDRGLQDSERILDIGAGRGRDLELFLKDGHDCTGLDLVEIDTWVDIRKKWGDQVRLESTPFLSFKPEQKYSTIMSIGSLHHQHPNDYGPFLQRVKELLEPGGRFLISVFHIKSEKGPGIFLNGQGRFWRFFTTEGLRTLLEDEGFVWVDSASNHESFFPYVWALVTRH